MTNDVPRIKGVILGYRRSKAVQYNDQVLVKLFAEPTMIASMVGAKVLAKDMHNNVYRGKIIRIHSQRNSVAIAKFKPNIPGQLIGHPIEVFVKRSSV